MSKMLPSWLEALSFSPNWIHFGALDKICMTPKYIVGGLPLQILGAIRAVATTGEPGEIFL